MERDKFSALQARWSAPPRFAPRRVTRAQREQEGANFMAFMTAVNGVKGVSGD